jgi:hypothetical protein
MTLEPFKLESSDDPGKKAGSQQRMVSLADAPDRERSGRSGVGGVPLVVSHGGGSNSTAMLIGMVRRGVRPDLIAFADTGGERPETYQFIGEFSAWLEAKGFPTITVCRTTGETLEENCLRRKALPSVAFGRQFKTCSQRWKIQPIDKMLNGWPVAVAAWGEGKRVIKLLGFDAGEAHRIKNYSDAKFVIEYPLVAWGWNRRRCVEVCAEEGFKPGKSSCFFCPNMKPGEILRLREAHPALVERAVAMERNAETKGGVVGLGRDWTWDALLSNDAAQERIFADYSEEMPCGCYDGGDSESEVGGGGAERQGDTPTPETL